MAKSGNEKILDGLIKHMLNSDSDPLTPLLDRYYLERDASPNRLREYVVDMKERPRPHGRLSPSKLCACERQAAFSFLGMPGRKVIDPDQQGVFDDGHWRHHRWQATFLDMEMVLGKDEFEVLGIEERAEYDPLCIAGNLDIVVRIGRLYWVIDFKGINSWGFDRVYREHQPHEAHVLQLVAYMRARKVRRGLLMYEHKDRNSIVVFVVNFTRKRWEEVEKWCEKVLRKMEEEKLPPMSMACSAGTILYEKCNWGHICYGNKTPEQIRKRMYRGFKGIDEAWESGKAVITAHEEENR